MRNGYIKQKLREFISKVKKDKGVIAVILFGNYVRNREYARDVDICLVVNNRNDKTGLTMKRLEYLSHTPKEFDIQIFQLLPLYIKIRVLKEGKFFFIRNQRPIYDLAYNTIKEYNLFERHYKEYIKVGV